MNRSRIVLVAFVVSGGLLVPGPPGARAGTSQAPLEGVTWSLRATRLLERASDVVVTAEFTGTTVTGESGCNRYTAPSSVDPEAGTMTIGPDIAGTRIACTGIRDRVERAYLARLPRVARYRSTATTLRLLDRAGKELLRYSAVDGGEAIQDRRWHVTTYDATTALLSPITGTTLTAAFDGATVSGDAGCNTFTGPYTVDGRSISIGPLASTLRACADSAVDEQERQYLRALALADTFTVAGRRLELRRADGGIAVLFDAPRRR